MQTMGRSGGLDLIFYAIVPNQQISSGRSHVDKAAAIFDVRERIACHKSLGPGCVNRRCADESLYLATKSAEQRVRSMRAARTRETTNMTGLHGCRRARRESDRSPTPVLASSPWQQSGLVMQCHEARRTELKRRQVFGGGRIEN
jgi:hypothetical protein